MSLVRQTTNGIYNLILGLAVTVKHLFKHAITLQYPKERWTMPERSRGTVVLLSDTETGKLNCTACLMCEKACPVAAITIEREKNPETKKFEPTSFTIDMGICCYCGLCEKACNFSAIKLTGKYEMSIYDKSELIYDMDFLQKLGRDVKYEKRKRVVKKTAVKKATAKPKTTEARAESGDKKAEGTSSTKDDGDVKEKPKNETEEGKE